MKSLVFLICVTLVSCKVSYNAYEALQKEVAHLKSINHKLMVRQKDQNYLRGGKEGLTK